MAGFGTSARYPAISGGAESSFFETLAFGASALRGGVGKSITAERAFVTGAAEDVDEDTGDDTVEGEDT